MPNSNTRTVTLTNNQKQIDVQLSDIRLMPTGVLIVSQGTGFNVMFSDEVKAIQFN